MNIVRLAWELEWALSGGRLYSRFTLAYHKSLYLPSVRRAYARARWTLYCHHEKVALLAWKLEGTFRVD